MSKMMQTLVVALSIVCAVNSLHLVKKGRYDTDTRFYNNIQDAVSHEKWDLAWTQLRLV